MIFSLFGALALAVVGLLALFPDPSLLPPTGLGGEKAALLFLLVASIAANLPPLQKRLQNSPDASAFGLLAAGVILFHLADRSRFVATQITFPFAPDDPFFVSFAAVTAVIGAFLGFPAVWRAWKRGEGGPERAFGAALLLILILGFGSFAFLGRYFTVGLGEELDPRPLPSLLGQSITYFALALCCRAAVAHEGVRIWTWRALPLVLAIVWARHTFAPVPLPAEEEL